MFKALEHDQKQGDTGGIFTLERKGPLNNEKYLLFSSEHGTFSNTIFLAIK